MKKTLIATAIAGAMSFAAAAQAAPVVYGNIQLAVDLKNNNTAGDNGSTLGFKGEEALDNGLTAIYKAEFEFSAGAQKGYTQTDKNNYTGLAKGDQAYLGVKGDFGTVRVGSFDTVDNDFVYDMLVAPEATNGAHSAFTNIEAQQVQYTGEFSGIKVGAAVKLNGTEKADSRNDNDKDKNNAMQVGVQLPAGPATVGVAYDTYKGALGVAASMDMDAINVAGAFETSDTVDSAISASAAMDYGMGSVYGLFTTGKNKAAGSKDQAFTAFGATYNLGAAMYVYVESASGKELDGTKADATAIGAVLSF